MPPPRAPRRPPEEARRGAYKPGVDIARARRRREDRLLGLRRHHRHDGLFKRRRDEPTPTATATSPASPPPSLPSPPPSSPPAQALAAADDSELQGLSAMVDGVWSEDTTVQLEATTQFRKLLSAEKNPPVKEVIRAGVLPRFAEFLSGHDLPELQMEAAWVLTNIASSDYTLLVTECGAVPKLVELLGSPNANIRHQAAWALGNIAADSPACRELVLEHGALTPLLAQFKECVKISVLRTATWMLVNLCFGKLPAEVQTTPILEVVSLLIHSADERILVDACWALYYLCDGADDELQVVLDAGVCPQLVNLLMHASINVLLPVILALARISAGNDAQVQILVENCILHCLVQFLTRNYPKSIKKQACLIVSNITAGSRAQIQAVIDANIISPLVLLMKNSEMDMRKEAAWAISSAACGGSTEQIQYLVSRGCLEPLCNVLTCQDADLLYTCLNGLQNILQAGETGKQDDEAATNPYAQFIQECGGLEILEDLQDIGNDTIYKLVIKLLEGYWDEEESHDQNSPASQDSTEAADDASDVATRPPSSSANDTE